jgi:hypothetical protein
VPPRTATKPPQRDQPIRGHGHVGVVSTHHAQIMPVMPDRGRQRASAQPEAAYKPAPHITIAPMPLQDADLQQIA